METIIRKKYSKEKLERKSYIYNNITIDIMKIFSSKEEIYHIFTS